jgi:hypothetical protein
MFCVLQIICEPTIFTDKREKKEVELQQGWTKTKGMGAYVAISVVNLPLFLSIKS